MSGTIKNSAQYLSRSIHEAPFLCGMIFYLFLLTLTWSTIRVYLMSYRTIIQVPLLLFIPALFWFSETIKNKRAKKQRLLTFREPRVLPKHDIDHLKASFPDSQINLFESILLPTLSLFYATFSSISQEAYYQQKLSAIHQMIKTLKQHPLLYSNQQQFKYRDIALTAFCFYRVLFDGAIDFYHQKIERQPLIEKSDPWVLLKRVPAKLSLVLGAQYWRLYEFFEAVFGDPKHLVLNDDIAEYFQLIAPYLDKIDFNTSGNNKSAEALSSNTEIPLSEPTREKQEERNVDDKASEATGVVRENKPSSFSLKNLKNLPEKKPHDPNNAHEQQQKQQKQKKQPVARLVDLLRKWIIKQANSNNARYQLNSGGYLFSNHLKFGKRTVFVTEPLIDKFLLSRGKTFVELKPDLTPPEYFIDQGLNRAELYKFDEMAISQDEVQTSVIIPIKSEESDDENTI